MHVFIALCAAGLGAETYIVSGSSVNFHTLLILFFSALFIYNAAQLNLSLFNQSQIKNPLVRLEGKFIPVITCTVSLIILFGLLTVCNPMQILVFIFTAVLSVCYMMPFKINGRRTKGLRNNLILKNIILSLTWASATVLFPLSLNSYEPAGNEILFIFFRRFFFIYALTVIYDLRDLEADKNAGMQTIALRFGERATKLWSISALVLFLVFTFFDPNLTGAENRQLFTALLLSAIFVALVILNTHKLRKNPYYSFIVDSSMAIQFLMVFAIRYV